jgi:prepilin-type N-terminal cleavage/methylation domain-containing protein
MSFLRSPKSLEYQRAFTLLEVMVGMAMLALLIGGAYAIVSHTITVIQTVKDIQNRNAEIENLFFTCRQSFESLPQNALIDASLVSDQKNTVPQIRIQNAPNFFNFKPYPVFVDKWLTTQAAPNGLIKLQFKQEGEKPFTLIDNLQSIDWFFTDLRHQDWHSEWHDPVNRPVYIKLQLKFSDETEVHEAIFEIPQKLPSS